MDFEVPATNEKWFFRHSGIEYGPYSPEVMRDMLVAARINSDLQIKRELETEWRNIANVAGIVHGTDFAAVLQDSFTPNATQSEFHRAQSHTSDHTTVLEANPAGDTRNKRLQRNRVDSRSRMAGDGFRFPKGAVIAFAGAWIGLNAIALLSMRDGYATERRYASIVYQIRNKVQELRRRNGSDSDWSKLYVESKEELEPIIRDLEKTADLQHPVRQHLLWAARDDLQPMIGANSPNLQTHERLFDQHMRQVEGLLANGT